MIGYNSLFDTFMFDLFPIIFIIVFVLIMGAFVFMFVKGILTWNRNNHSPRLTVAATLVTKRTDVSHHSHAQAGDVTGAAGHTHSFSTRYYVTFQVESGDRMEFEVEGTEYGMLAEGDHGKLSFQGSRFLAFVRT